MSTVLIVDDNSQNLYMLQVLLSANGFEVAQASNGAEALEQIHQAAPDLIVSDILMPVMDGFALCRAVREDARYKEIPFIFYTATYTDPKDETFAISLGADRFLVKPTEPEQFLATLQDVIRSPRAGRKAAPAKPLDEKEYFTTYNAVLVHKLEDKVEQLENANRALTSEIEKSKLIEEELRQSEDKFKYIFDHSIIGKSITLISGEISANKAFCDFLGYRAEEMKGKKWSEFTHPDDIGMNQSIFDSILGGETETGRFEKRYIRKDGSIVWAEVSTSLRRDNEGKPLYFMTSVLDIDERKKAATALAKKSEELARLYRASGSLLSDSSLSLQELAQTIVKTIQQEFGQANCSLLFVEMGKDALTRLAIAGPYANQVREKVLTLAEPGIVASAIRTGQIVNVPDVLSFPGYIPNWEEARSELAIPLRVGESVIGAIDIQGTSPNAFSPDDERLVAIFAERAAIALEQARLYTETEQRLENLNSLRSVDMAMASSVNINLTLNILLEQVQKRMGVEAADILIFQPANLSFRFLAWQGYQIGQLAQNDLHLSNDIAARVVHERNNVKIDLLGGSWGREQRIADLVRGGFASYLGVPLIAKGMVKGVMELFKKGRISLEPEQNVLLDALARQAAIAIDADQLFENLQSSNTELVMAYDETIEGWSQALDLRDKETEGHSRRVTEMTVRLAEKFSINQIDLTQIRRGALLHDIGKLGVPDAILNNPGALTESEWVIMRRHPQFAYDMLAPIAYLHSAIDIPYCHHEKWDGSGYPRGLKGNQIPLAARIFAVVDVWDALTSDRPYRKAWTQGKAREYLQEQSGSHFDPEIVTKFLNDIVPPAQGGEG
jgi:PAS domain S-box-containing protein